MKRTWIKRGSLLLLLLLGAWGEAMSQKMKVESFVELSQAEDPDAKDPTFRRVDTQASRNGRYCAIIKLVTTVEDKAFTFDLGTDFVPEAVEYKDNGEIWIYVPAGTNKIKISHKRHGQLDTRDGYYNFKEVGIAKCKEATVYRLRLHTDFNPDEDIIKDPNKLATVKFKVYPASATVILRKIPESCSNGTLEKQMPLGIYHYRVTHPDYHDSDGTFELTAENETKPIDVRLNQAFGWLALNPSFTPDGYTFIVDGENTTAASLKRMTLHSGMHTVEIQHPNYLSQTMQVMVQDSAVHDFYPQLQPRLGRLSVKVNTPGAIVSVDGEEIGVTPLLETYELMIGNHTVKVTCANHRTEERTVAITENQTTNLSVSLVDIARYTFSSIPVAAGLYINDKYIGTTPCHHELASGDYRIKLTHRRYRTIDENMHLDSSDPMVSFRMSRQYQQRYQMYLQPTLQYGVQMGWGGTAGLYLANVNIEAAYLMKRKSGPIYWNYLGESGNRPIVETFSPTAIKVHVGYGFIIGTRFRFTPQVGVNTIDYRGNQGNRCCAVTASTGARIECIVANHLGICLAPRYVLPVYGSDNFIRISETLSQLNDYAAGGFNMNVGLYLYF